MLISRLVVGIWTIWLANNLLEFGSPFERSRRDGNINDRQTGRLCGLETGLKLIDPVYL